MRIPRKGEKVVYHTGNLAQDKVDDKNLTSIAGRYYHLQRVGRVMLFQKKIDLFVYEYTAVGV